jgi:Leucine-rich repeat (LRR) protein
VTNLETRFLATKGHLSWPVKEHFKAEKPGFFPWLRFNVVLSGVKMSQITDNLSFNASGAGKPRSYSQPGGSASAQLPLYVMGAGLVFSFIVAIGGSSLWLKPPFLTHTLLVYLAFILIWLPVLVICTLLKPRGGQSKFIVLLSFGLGQTLLSTILIISGLGVVGILRASILNECNPHRLPGWRVRYVCTIEEPADVPRLYSSDQLVFEGYRLSPFLTMPKAGEVITNLHQFPDFKRDIVTLYTIYREGEAITGLIELAAASGSPSLDLSGMGLTKLPPEIGQLSQLQELNLEDNRLTELPPEIGQLTNLTRLNLRYNNLTSLPPEIWQLNLKTLELVGNSVLESAEVKEGSPLAELPDPVLSGQTGPSRVIPTTCASVGSGDWVQVLSINPPPGTPLKIGQTYTFVIKARYQVETRNEALLEAAIYSFQEDYGIGVAGDNAVEVTRGCGIGEITLIHTVPDHDQTEMKLVVASRVNAEIVLSEWEFSQSFPVSQ